MLLSQRGLLLTDDSSFLPLMHLFSGYTNIGHLSARGGGGNKQAKQKTKGGKITKKTTTTTQQKYM